MKRTIDVETYESATRVGMSWRTLALVVATSAAFGALGLALLLMVLVPR
jgi:hypothetical protein